jgi:hypothetical protein
MPSRRDWYLAVGLTAAYTVNVMLRQGCVGEGWDGRDYMAVARGTLGDPLSSEYAYAHSLRIGVPYLARYFPFADLLFNFEVINVLCGIVFSVFAYLAVAAVLERQSLLTTLTAWVLLTANHLALPFSVWYPAQTDSANDALVMLLIFIVAARRIAAPAAFALACFLIFMAGALVRESFPAFLAFLLAPTLRRTLVGMGAGALGSAAGFAVIFYVTGLDPLARTGQLRVVLEWQHLVPVLAALVMVYGSAALFAMLTRAEGLPPVPIRAPRERGYLELGFLAVLVVALGGWRGQQRALSLLGSAGGGAGRRPPHRGADPRTSLRGVGARRALHARLSARAGADRDERNGRLRPRYHRRRPRHLRRALVTGMPRCIVPPAGLLRAGLCRGARPRRRRGNAPQPLAE